MKKVLIIVGMIALAGFAALAVIFPVVVGEVRRAEGSALYSGRGAWTRIQEYAHAQGKTNYIAYADSQLSAIQDLLNQWQKTAGTPDLSKLHQAETNAYSDVDKNIKSGFNPLSYLDETNFSITVPTMGSIGATNE